jgi:hypothetical protein
VDFEAEGRADAAQRVLVRAGEGAVSALGEIQLARTNVEMKIASEAAPTTASDSRPRWLTAMPVRIHTAARPSPAAIRVAAASTTSARTSPCWNVATITGGV